MEIQKTLNYFQFKRITSNRPVDSKHVDALVKKIKVKDLLHLFPILVNNSFEVVDGQHRLAAAERLGIYVHYQVDGQISKADIANVNVLAKNWSMIDFINYWSVEGAPGFDVFSDYMIANPFIAVSTVMKLLDGANTTADIKEGRVKTGRLEQANLISGYLKELDTIISFAYQRNFVLALMAIVRIKGYDHDNMMKKIKLQPRSMVNCISVKQYTEMLEDIYNYGSSKNRLSFK